MIDETLSQYEFETAPFTPAELAAVARYREAINGIDDLVGGIEPQNLIRLGPGLEATGVRYLIARMADDLNKWYRTLDRVLTEMQTCTADSSTYSVAARRFLNFESSVYHQTRQKFEYAVTVFVLGRHAGPVGDYPPATITLGLAQHTVVGPA